jgi:hypothetical protein
MCLISVDEMAKFECNERTYSLTTRGVVDFYNGSSELCYGYFSESEESPHDHCNHQKHHQSHEFPFQCRLHLMSTPKTCKSSNEHLVC